MGLSADRSVAKNGETMPTFIYSMYILHCLIKDDSKGLIQKKQYAKINRAILFTKQNRPTRQLLEFHPFE